MTTPRADVSQHPQRPTLLSGGNPQIPKGDGEAPVQAYLQAMPGWKQSVGVQLDTLITQTVPDVRKAVRWNTPFYGRPDQGWFLAFHCYTRYLKVTFFNGSALHPLPPVASKQSAVRYAHLHEDEPFNSAQLTTWIQQAAVRPGEPMF